MLYTIAKIRVSGFRKSTGSILQSWANHYTEQNLNTLKITKKAQKLMKYSSYVIVWDLDQSKA